MEVDTKPIIVGLIPKANIPKSTLNYEKQMTSHRHTLTCRRNTRNFENDLYLDNYLSLQLRPKNLSNTIIEHQEYKICSRENSIIEDSIDFTNTLKMWKTVEKNAKQMEIKNTKCRKKEDNKKSTWTFNINLKISNSFKYEKISRQVSFRSDSKSLKRSFKENFVVDLKKLMTENIKNSINILHTSSIQRISRPKEEISCIKSREENICGQEQHIEIGFDLCDTRTSFEDHFEKSMSLEEIKKELLFCRENATLRKSNLRLRMEKLILLKSLTHEKPCDEKPLDTSNKDLTNIFIKNLHFYIKNEHSKHYVYYYMCTLTKDNDIISTEVTKPIKNSIYFNDELNFEQIKNNSSLTVNLYSMKIKISKENRFATFSKLLKRKFSTIMNWSSRRANTNSLPKSLSDFKLLGSSTFNNLQELKLNSNNSKTVKDFDMCPKDGIEGVMSVGVKSDNDFVWRKRWFNLENL